MYDYHLLYSFRRCPYAMRARLGISSASIKVELREIVLRNKPGHMIELSPKATVPVLRLKTGQVIDESLDIAIWALRQNDPQNLLTPQDGSLKDMLEMIKENDGPFKHHLDRTKYAVRYPEDNKEDHIKGASGFLLKLNNRLSSQKFLFGNQRSLADITIAPFVRQFANIDRSWFDAQPWPHLIKWLNEFLESEQFLSIMEKYAPWQEGDEIIWFPKSTQC
ncbi:MAG: glutathione S-transferase [Rhizobiales bacterium]|nr:glutathione S-transferase [Hyphomicrobiales bacterium]